VVGKGFVAQASYAEKTVNTRACNKKCELKVKIGEVWVTCFLHPPGMNCWLGTRSQDAIRRHGVTGDLSRPANLVTVMI